MKYTQVLGMLGLLYVTAGLGCSNLVVKKVPLQQRAEGWDCQQGFRYYLNRPYLIVKEPILLFECKTLVDINDEKFAEAFLHGESHTTQGSAQQVNSQHLQEIQTQLMNSQGTAAELPEGARASAAADSSERLEMPKTETLPTDTELQGKMQIVYLPDLDEQYVIKSKNWIAKSAFALIFKNGSELVEVNGEHDATTVTLSIFKQIQQAIGVAQEVAQAEITQSAKATPAPVVTNRTGTSAMAADAVTEVVQPVYQRIEKTYIKAGVYRLNKPWEIEDAECHVPTGMRLLTKLGLPTCTDVRFERIGQLGPAK